MIMPSIILEEQGAFVSSRVIQDNLLVAQELFYFFIRKKKIKKWFFTVKTDMAKVYDRVDWGFFEALLLKMGFDQIWVQRILSCVCSVTYKVIVNGCPQNSFIPQRGSG